MANKFNLTAEINLRGPANIKNVVSSIRRELGVVTADVKVKIDPGSAKNISGITSKLRVMNDILITSKNNVDSLNLSFKKLSASLNATNAGNQKISTSISKTNSSMKDVAKSTAIATSRMEEFGKQSALAIKRFAAFSFVATGIYSVINAINQGIKSFIDYDRQLVRLQQITGDSRTQIGYLDNTITNLAVTLGVSSSSLIDVADTLAQAGLTASETRAALTALAKTELAPSFDDITQTTEGAIAAMRQFGLAATELEGVLGSINAVAAAFAVESSDIITAIQRTGGVFAAASKGVSEGSDALNEFIAVFTSVRATTRESAETIATGLRTIFTRLQRSSTIDTLKQFGIQLTDLEGKFVGPYEAIKRISEGLKSLDPRDLRFAGIIEELGGFRQVGKVIPLIQQFATAQKALAVAQKGQNSLSSVQSKAQEALAVKFAKVREEFLALVRDIGKSSTFQALAKIVLGLASTFIKLVSAFKPILPILAIMGAIKGASAVTKFAGGFFGSFKKGGGAQAAGSNIGAAVTGAAEKERAQAVTKASEATRLNTDALRSLTSTIQSLEKTIKSRPSSTLSGGGKVYGFNKGGLVPGNGGGDTVPAFLEGGEVVMSRRAVKKYGAGNLVKMNKYAAGGDITVKGVSPQRYPLDDSAIDASNLSPSAKGALRGIMFENDFSKKFKTPINPSGFPDIKNKRVARAIGGSKAEALELKYAVTDRTKKDYKSGLASLKPKKTTDQIPMVVRKNSGGKIQRFAEGGSPVVGTGIYDSDKIAGSIKQAILGSILDSGKPYDVLHGPAGAGKTTMAQKMYGDNFVLSADDVSRYAEFLVLSGAGITKSGDFSPALMQILGGARKIIALDPDANRLESQRSKRVEDALLGKIGDTRSVSQLQATTKAPGSVASEVMRRFADKTQILQQYGKGSTGGVEELGSRGGLSSESLRRAIVTDFDDTVAESDAVVKTGVADPYEDFRGQRAVDFIKNAKATRYAEMIKKRVAKGYDVHVLTARPNEPDTLEAIQEFMTRAVGARATSVIGTAELSEMVGGTAKAKASELSRLKEFYDQIIFLDDNGENVLAGSEVEGVKARIAKKFMGGMIQKFANGSRGGIKLATKGRGKEGARGARTKYDIPSIEDFVSWSRGIYADYEADPSLVKTTYMGMSMPPEIAYANMLLSQMAFETGGAGLSVGKKFVRTPADKIDDALRPYLVPDPSDPSQLGFYEDDVRPFQRAKTKALTAAQAQRMDAKFDRGQALKAQEAKQASYVAATNAVSDFVKTGSLDVDPSIMEHIKNTISNPDSLIGSSLDEDEIETFKKKLTKPNLQAFADLTGPDKIPVGVQGQRTALGRVFSLALESYGNDSVDDMAQGLVFKQLSNIQAKYLGGMIQKFPNGSVGGVQPINEERLTPQELYEWIQSLGNPQDIRGLAGGSNFIDQKLSSVVSTKPATAKEIFKKSFILGDQSEPYLATVQELLTIAHNNKKKPRIFTDEEKANATKVGLVGMLPFGVDQLLYEQIGDKILAIQMKSLTQDKGIVVDQMRKDIDAVIGKGTQALYGDPGKDLDDPTKEALGLGNLEGYMIEAILARAGANPGKLNDRSVDYASGLGAAASLFGIDPNIPTEVKRDVKGGLSKARANFRNYFAKLAFGGKAGKKSLPSVNQVGAELAEKMDLVKGPNAYNQTKDNCFAVAIEVAKKLGYEADADRISAQIDNFVKLRAGSKLGYGFVPSKESLAKSPGIKRLLEDPTSIVSTGNILVRESEELMKHASFETMGKEYNFGAAGADWPIRVRIPLKKKKQESLFGGGIINKFASGGTVPAMVSNGEAFVPPKVAKSIGYAKLDRMNQADRNGMKSFAEGGISVFKGPGSGTSDSIGPVGLPTGSYVIREKATKALGLNKGGSVGVRKFANGGSPIISTDIGNIINTEFNYLEEALDPFIAQITSGTASFDTVIDGLEKLANGIGPAASEARDLANRLKQDRDYIIGKTEAPSEVPSFVDSAGRPVGADASRAAAYSEARSAAAEKESKREFIETQTPGRKSKAERKKLKEQYLADQRGGITREEARAVGMPRPDFGAGASRRRDVMATPQGKMNVKNIEAEVLNNYDKLYAEEEKRIDDFYDALGDQARDEFFQGEISADELTSRLETIFEARLRKKGQAKEKLTAQAQVAQAQAVEEYKTGKQTSSIEKRKEADTAAFSSEVQSSMDQVVKEAKAKYEALYSEEKQRLKDYYQAKAKKVADEGGDVAAVIDEYRAAVGELKQSVTSGFQSEVKEKQAQVPEQIAEQKRVQVEERRAADATKAEEAARAVDPWYDVKKAVDAGGRRAGPGPPTPGAPPPRASGLPMVDAKLAEERRKAFSNAAESRGMTDAQLAQKISADAAARSTRIQEDAAKAKRDIRSIGSNRESLLRGMAGDNLSERRKEDSTEGKKLDAMLDELTAKFEALGFSNEEASRRALAYAEAISNSTGPIEEVILGNDLLRESMERIITPAEALAMGFEEAAEAAGVSAETARAGGVTRNTLEQQQFIQSKEGQKYGMFGQIAPNLAKKMSESGLGKFASKFDNFVSGNGGAISQLIGKAGGIQGIGTAITGATPMVADFLEKQGLIDQSDPNTAGVVGGISGAASGAAMGAQFGSYLGPEGTLIGAIGGAIVGGIKGFFEAKQQAIFQNAMERLSESSNAASLALEKLEKDSSPENIKAFDKAMGDMAVAQQDIGNIAFGEQQNVLDSATSGSAAAGAAAGAAIGAAIGSVVPVLGKAIGAAAGTAIGYLGGMAADYYSKPTEEQTKESREAYSKASTFAYEAQTKVGSIKTSKKSSEDIGKMLKELEAGNAKVGPIVQSYADAIIESNPKIGRARAEQIADEKSALDAYIAMRTKVVGAEKAMEEVADNRDKALEQGKRLRDEDQKRIATEQALARAIKQVQLANLELEDVYRRLGGNLQRFSDEIGDSVKSVNQYIDMLTGDAKMPEVDRGNAERVLGNISGYSLEEVSLASNQAASVLGNTPEAQKLAQQATSAKIIEDKLPALLKANASDPKAAVGQLKELMSAQGVDPEIQKTVLDKVETAMKENEGSDMDTVINEIIPEIAGEIGKGAQNAASRLQEVQKKYNDTLQEIINLHQQQAQAILSANESYRKAGQIRMNAEIELAKTLGKDLSLDELNKPFETEIQNLTSGMVNMGALAADQAMNPEAIGAGISTMSARGEELIARNKEIDLARTSATTPEQSAALTQEYLANAQAIQENNVALQEGKKALETLANDGSRAANALAKIQEEQKKVQAFGNSLEDALTASPEQLIKQNINTKAMQQALAGNRAVLQTSSGRLAAFEGLKQDRELIGEEEYNKRRGKLMRESLMATQGSLTATQEKMIANLEAGGPGEEDPNVKAYREATEAQITANKVQGDLQIQASNRLTLKMDELASKLINDLPNALANALTAAQAAQQTAAEVGKPKEMSKEKQQESNKREKTDKEAAQRQADIQKAEEDWKKKSDQKAKLERKAKEAEGWGGPGAVMARSLADNAAQQEQQASARLERLKIEDKKATETETSRRSKFDEEQKVKDKAEQDKKVAESAAKVEEVRQRSLAARSATSTTPTTSAGGKPSLSSAPTPSIPPEAMPRPKTTPSTQPGVVSPTRTPEEENAIEAKKKADKEWADKYRKENPEYANDANEIEGGKSTLEARAARGEKLSDNQMMELEEGRREEFFRRKHSGESDLDYDQMVKARQARALEYEQKQQSASQAPVVTQPTVSAINAYSNPQHPFVQGLRPSTSQVQAQETDAIDAALKTGTLTAAARPGGATGVSPIRAKYNKGAETMAAIQETRREEYLSRMNPAQRARAMKKMGTGEHPGTPSSSEATKEFMNRPVKPQEKAVEDLGGVVDPLASAIDTGLQNSQVATTSVKTAVEALNDPMARMSALADAGLQAGSIYTHDIGMQEKITGLTDAFNTYSTLTQSDPGLLVSDIKVLEAINLLQLPMAAMEQMAMAALSEGIFTKDSQIPGLIEALKSNNPIQAVGEEIQNFGQSIVGSVAGTVQSIASNVFGTELDDQTASAIGGGALLAAPAMIPMALPAIAMGGAYNYMTGQNGSKSKKDEENEGQNNQTPTTRTTPSPRLQQIGQKAEGRIVSAPLRPTPVTPVPSSSPSPTPTTQNNQPAGGPNGGTGYSLTIDDKSMKFLQDLTNTFNTFGTYVDKLANLDLKLELTGNYTIDVNITGAAGLTALDKNMRELATELVESKIADLRDEISSVTRGAVKPSASRGR